MIRSERKLHIEPAPDEEQFQLKVAFATQDRHHVDQHFGTAKGVLIYGVGLEKWSLLEAIEYPAITEQTHDKLPGRISDLKECQCSAIFCNACGASAIRQLLGEDINPVKVSQGTDIHMLLAEIQCEMRGKPMGWLGRALKSAEKKSKDKDTTQQRLSGLMDEDW
ncbi:NifB/NifX family molybdenum-iron cluster-binding protein [Vibrio sp. JC009]|uniref:NifB/NifX family molybdenum-iron cluster-binding protein n=1 Tax=Vibrio sp. JC009 TaxID=2912314 RepID=UPI0023AE98C4|nr:NifB/NifX family molybdenum-iron cluster-binding protein [Vibrio sp. JC009]WED24075.1 NifB/NifX family molybdenum-iron cluster-binding protein [Vibrio sp. JC009]